MYCVRVNVCVTHDILSISEDETNSRVSFPNPSPHNSVGGDDNSVQTRTTAPGHPRAVKEGKRERGKKKKAKENMSQIFFRVERGVS